MGATRPERGFASRAEAMAWVMRSELSLMALHATPERRGIDAREGSLVRELAKVKEAFGFTEDQLAAQRLSIARQVVPHGVNPSYFAYTMGEVPTGRAPSFTFEPEALRAAVLAEANRGPNGEIIKPPMLGKDVQQKAEEILLRGVQHRVPAERVHRQLDELRAASGMDRETFESTVRSRVEEAVRTHGTGSVSGLVRGMEASFNGYVEKGKAEGAAAAATATDAAARQAMERKVEAIAAREAELKADRVEGKPVDPEALKKLRADIAGLSPDEQRALTAARERAAKETSLVVDGKPTTLAQHEKEKGEVKLDGEAPRAAAEPLQDKSAALKVAMKGAKLDKDALAALGRTMVDPDKDKTTIPAKPIIAAAIPKAAHAAIQV